MVFSAPLYIGTNEDGSRNYYDLEGDLTKLMGRWGCREVDELHEVNLASKSSITTKLYELSSDGTVQIKLSSERDISFRDADGELSRCNGLISLIGFDISRQLYGALQNQIHELAKAYGRDRK